MVLIIMNQLVKIYEIKSMKSYFFLYQGKGITKKVYNNIMKSVQIQNGYYIYENRKESNF